METKNLLTRSSIEELIKKIHTEIDHATSDIIIEEIRVATVGRQGNVTLLLSQLKNLSIDEKRTLGPLLNMVRKEVETHIEQRKKELTQQAYNAALLRYKNFDITATAVPAPMIGSVHPYTHIINLISNIFISMGFEYVEGPEIETPFYNFDALNIPQDHPARDLHDTFWIENSESLLRTHTSTVQIRTMKKRKPPFAIFSPGRVFRHEATDATHDFVFMQCEGLLINKNISLGNLIATLQQFMNALFEKRETPIRVRPSAFPFVKPGIEVDIECPFCTEGCSLCKKTRWIELCGAGLIHPHVFSSCNIDYDIYNGFAFGFGIDRLVMLKYGITDIRLLRSGTIDFLKQF